MPRLWRWVTVMLALSLLGCASIPKGQSAVDHVDLEGNENLSERTVEKQIATQASPRFLGLFQGVVYDYEVFNRFVLERDLQRVERYYRARGYYRARARAGRVTYDGPKHVKVLIVVDEGPPTLVRRVVINNVAALPTELRTSIVAAANEHVAIDSVFEEKKFEDAEKAIVRALKNAGYAHASAKRIAEVDLPRNYASLRFDVKVGVLATFGTVRIEGLGKIPEAPVRRALDIHPGDPYSQADIDAARQALLDLGVFGTVEISPEENTPEDSKVVNLVVHVEPSKLHAVELGGGVQADVIKSDVHLKLGWHHKNFLGGLRKLSVEVKPGLVFFPTRFPSFEKPTAYLPEVRSRAELTQPGFIEARTNGFLRAEYDIYAVLLSPDVDPAAPILGYRELRGSAGVDRTIGRFYGRTAHNVQVSSPFTYVGQLDPDLDRVIVSYPSILTSFDLRDNRVRPHAGVFVSNQLEVAGGPFGGHARDVKVQPEGRFYIPIGDDLTLAARASTGLLFPQNYGDTLEANARGEVPNASRATWVRDVQIGFFRNFFSGGPSSNRGYPLRGIGPHGVVPFFSPQIASSTLTNNCENGIPGFDDARCLLPLGGFTLWEASLELRYPIAGDLSGSVFCDTSDVAPKTGQYRFDRPHLSCGAGARYDTPIGPIRLDIGYRVPGMQTLGDDSGEGDPPTIFGAPIAVAIAIGEAF
jgi:outer membrane protein insertion porin family/translocation and assembly module TamA